MRVQRIKASEIKQGALIEGETLLEAIDALNIDYMEGIAAIARLRARPSSP